MAKLKSGFYGERAIIIPNPIIDDLRVDELGELLHITDIGYYPKAVFHYRRRSKDEANQFILIYCVDGLGWFELDGIKYEVRENHFFILPKQKAHVYGCDKKNPWTIYWIHFDGLKASFFADGLSKPIEILPERNSRIEERFALFEEIFLTLSKGYSKPNLHYSISSLFHFLGSLKFVGVYRASAATSNNERDVIENVIHFMRENVNKKLTLKEIASYSGLSTSHFSMVFQKKTGRSPSTYFTQLKIQNACHHLDFTQMKICQIATLIGYDDQFYFTRVFTKTMGVSPTEYRNKKKG